MKKLVSIFLLALYAMSVSASVVRIRYCGMMQGKVVIATIENNDCCCTDEGLMNLRPESKQSDYLMVMAGQLANNNAYTVTTPKKCCTEIVLQTRLNANQLVSSETNTVLDQAPQLLPIMQYNPLPVVYLPQQHQPKATDFKDPPPRIPLYKLFQRFTYYG